MGCVRGLELSECARGGVPRLRIGIAECADEPAACLRDGGLGRVRGDATDEPGEPSARGARRGAEARDGLRDDTRGVSRLDAEYGALRGACELLVLFAEEVEEVVEVPDARGVAGVPDAGGQGVGRTRGRRHDPHGLHDFEGARNHGTTWRVLFSEETT